MAIPSCRAFGLQTTISRPASRGHPLLQRKSRYGTQKENSRAVSFRRSQKARGLDDFSGTPGGILEPTKQAMKGQPCWATPPDPLLRRRRRTLGITGTYTERTASSDAEYHTASPVTADDTNTAPVSLQAGCPLDKLRRFIHAEFDKIGRDATGKHEAATKLQVLTQRIVDEAISPDASRVGRCSSIVFIPLSVATRSPARISNQPSVDLI